MTSIFQTLRGTTIRTGRRLSLRPNINININRNLINITSRTLFIATVSASASAILLSHHIKPARALIIGQTASATPSSSSSLKFATHSSSNVLGASDSDSDRDIMGNNRDGNGDGDEIIRNNNDIDIDTKNHKQNKKKTVEELRIQWKGGRDVWPKVPLLPEEIIEAPSVSVDGDADGDRDADAVVVGLNTTKYISIQTRVKVNNDDFEKSMSYSTRNSNDIHKTLHQNENENDAQALTQRQRHKRTPPWPQIIQEYTLFGFGAYNPRGQEAPDDVNERQHDLLRQDIQSALSRYTTIDTHGNTNTNMMMATYWDSAAIWEDGSSEEGFIIAFRNNGMPSSSSLHVQEGLKMSIELARKYDQGAIYKYTYEYRHGNDFAERGGGGGSLIRDTIAVMDEGSEATVEVEIDPDCMN